MEIDQLPPNDQMPNVIAAFQGWNDAGQAATTAVRFLIDAWKAQPFARIDAEDYFSFSDTRPMIRIVEGDQRELVWPKNEFYYSEGSGDAVRVSSPSRDELQNVIALLKAQTYDVELQFGNYRS